MRTKTPDDVLTIKDVQEDYNLSRNSAINQIKKVKTRLNKERGSLLTRRDFEAVLKLNLTLK